MPNKPVQNLMQYKGADTPIVDPKPRKKLSLIWKQEFSLEDKVKLLLPKSTRPLEILSVMKTAAGRYAFWFTFTPSISPKTVGPETEPYTLSVIPTGANYDPDKVGAFIGTVLDAPYVWHIFLCKDD